MLKNLSLSLLLFIVPIATCTPNFDRIATIKSTLDHIKEERKSIVLILQTNVSAGNKAMMLMKNTLQADLQSQLSRVNEAIKSIAQSNEFISTVNQVTDHMATEIVDNLKKYDSISINSDDYPLKDTVNGVVDHAFCADDENALQLFNISYVIGANIYCTTLLLKKLELRNEELLAEISTVEAANQSITE